jgi:hypothetical protein
MPTQRRATRKRPAASKHRKNPAKLPDDSSDADVESGVESEPTVAPSQASKKRRVEEPAPKVLGELTAERTGKYQSLIGWELTRDSSSKNQGSKQRL